MMADLVTENRFADPDRAFRQLIEARRGLSPERRRRWMPASCCCSRTISAMIACSHRRSPPQKPQAFPIRRLDGSSRTVLYLQRGRVGDYRD